MHELTCQAPHPDPRRAGRGEAHGQVLTSSSAPMVYTGRLLSDVLDVHVDQGHRIAPWCRQCRKASEYMEHEAA